jgi:transcriptional regulator with XRE-family HTH domain
MDWSDSPRQYLIGYTIVVVAWAILRDARDRAGLTQAALAELAGKPQSTIAKIERGRRDPTLTTLLELVRAAGFDLRIELAPRDHHDEQLIDAMLSAPVEQRLDSLEELSAFFASVRPSERARR